MALVAYDNSDCSDYDDEDNEISVVSTLPNIDGLSTSSHNPEDKTHENIEDGIPQSNEADADGVSLFNLLPQPSKKKSAVIEEDDEFLHKKEKVDLVKPKAKITFGKQLQASQSMPSMPPLPVGAPPVPPPPDQPPPPPPPHENNQPLYGNSAQSTAPRNISNVVSTDAIGNKHWPYGTDAVKETAATVNKDALKKLAEEEKSFDIQFQKWEEEIERWRQENVNHPDKQAYREYEERFEVCRAQLLERRKQMQLKKASLLNSTPNAPRTATTPSGNAPIQTTAPISQNISTNYNQSAQNQNYKNSYQQAYENAQPPFRNNNTVIETQPQSFNNSRNNKILETESSFNNLRSNNKNMDPQDRYEEESYNDMGSGSLPPQRDSQSGAKSDPTTFLPTSSSRKSIPGLDLVIENTKNQDVIDITDDPNEMQEAPDYSKISKGINNILGDAKIMNILSMVKVQNIPSANVGQNTMPNISHFPPNQGNRNENNFDQTQHGNKQNILYNRQGPNDSMQQNQMDSTGSEMQQEHYGNRNAPYHGHSNNRGGPELSQGGPGMRQSGAIWDARNMRIGGPDMRQGGHDMRQGGPNMKHGLGGIDMQQSGPNMRQGGPNMRQGGPDNMMNSGPDIRQGGPENIQFGSDLRQGGPEMRQIGLNMTLGGPNLRQGGINMRQGGPDMRQGGSDMRQGGSDMRQGGSDMRQGGGDMRQGVSNFRQGGPDMRQGGPDIRQGGPHMRQGGPDMIQGGPDMRLGGPDMRQGGPDMRQGGPEMRQGGSDTRQGGMNMRQSGPEMRQGGPNMRSDMDQGGSNMPTNHDMRCAGPNNQGSNNNGVIPSLMSINSRPPLQDMSSQQNIDDYYSSEKPMGINNAAINQPSQTKWEDPLFTPSLLVDYEHQPLRLKARDFIEPVHTFDYNHRSKDEDLNKKKDFEKEVDELFTRLPRRQDPDNRYTKDLYHRDFERRAPREDVRDIRDTRDLRADFRDGRDDYRDRERVDFRDDFRGMRGPRDLPRESPLSRESPREDFERRRFDDRLNDRRRDDVRDIRRDDGRDIRRDDFRNRRDDRDSRRDDRDSRRDERDSRRDERDLRRDDRDSRRDDRYDDRDRLYRRDDLRDRERDRDAYRPRDDRSRDSKRDDSKTRSKSIERDSRKRGLSKESDTSSASKKAKENKGNDKDKHVVMIDDILETPGRDMRPEKLVIILRGLPGSGKSYLAKLIRDREAEHGGSARIMSIDDYFMQEGETEEKDPQTGKMVKKPFLKYEYDESSEETYLNSLKRAFKRSLTDGYFSFLIYDAVNDQLKHYADVWNYARQCGFQVYICTLELDAQTCFKRNIHNRKFEDIEVLKARFFDTPSHHIQLDPTTLLQSASIQEVQMEDVEDDDVIMEDVTEVEVESVFTSKWEKMDDAVQLARLDGTSKPLRASRPSMADYLQLDDWKPNVAKPGKKTVRWADIEEQREQERIRAIGFVVGQTDWNRMNDPTQGSSALTQTKYIERVRR